MTGEVVAQPFPGALARQLGAAPVDVVFALSPAVGGAPGHPPQDSLPQVA